MLRHAALAGIVAAVLSATALTGTAESQAAPPQI
jgi:hypothetical protein